MNEEAEFQDHKSQTLIRVQNTTITDGTTRFGCKPNVCIVVGIRNNTDMVLKMYIIRYMVIRVYVMERSLVFISNGMRIRTDAPF